jgi:biopolymer transport protein ExbD
MMEDEKATNGINITPLIDVSLVLVLVFMVTAPLSAIYSINVRKETLKKYGLSKPQENIRVHLTENGPRVLDEKNREQAVPAEKLGIVMRQMIQLSPTGNVMLQVDRAVPHGQTVWVLDLSKQNGAADVSLLENF